MHSRRDGPQSTEEKEIMLEVYLRQWKVDLTTSLPSNWQEYNIPPFALRSLHVFSRGLSIFGGGLLSASDIFPLPAGHTYALI